MYDPKKGETASFFPHNFFSSSFLLLLDPATGQEKNRDPEFQINILDPQHWSNDLLNVPTWCTSPCRQNTCAVGPRANIKKSHLSFGFEQSLSTEENRKKLIERIELDNVKLFSVSNCELFYKCFPVKQSIKRFITDQAFLRSYGSAPRLPLPPPPLPSESCLSISVILCVAGRA